MGVCLIATLRFNSDRIWIYQTFFKYLVDKQVSDCFKLGQKFVFPQKVLVRNKMQ